MPEDPNWRDEIGKRLASLHLAPEREAEIIDELAGHLNDEYRRHLSSGATEAEALETASRAERPPAAGGGNARRGAHGSPRAHRPRHAGSSLAGDLWRDLRYSWRTLTRSPGFTALAVLSLALGIGGNAAMFRIVSAALIRPLAFADPDRLVAAAESGYYPPGGLADLQQESRTMELAGYVPGLELNFTGWGEPWRLRGSAVSANLFQVLGVGMELGRPFGPGEDEPGRTRGILSHELWQDRFGAPAFSAAW